MIISVSWHSSQDLVVELCLRIESAISVDLGIVAISAPSRFLPYFLLPIRSISVINSRFHH